MTEIFKALSDETRIRILLILLKAGKELCICDLMEILDMPQYAISRHIKELKNRGLVSCKRKGKFVYYQEVFKEEPFFKNLKEALLTMQTHEKDLKKFKEIKKEIKERC